MKRYKFCDFIEHVISELEKIANVHPEKIISCNTGEAFEVLVYEVVCACMRSYALDPGMTVDYSEGSHRFPDIIILLNGKKYGIEVKSSSSKNKSWKINGNSILGSTKDKDVFEIYIIYGKTSINNLEFKARRYEDCVENIVVTHSPRYLINMDLVKGSSFFDKSGISYKEISSSAHPIELITDYFKRIGEKAWWLAESTPAAFSYYNTLDRKYQIELRAYAFVHFPEILGTNQTKYKNFAIWLVIERSIVCSSLRDIFTGGGRQDISCETKAYANMPRILTSLKECKKQFLNSLEEADVSSLASDWRTSAHIGESLDEKLEAWIEVSKEYVQQSIDGHDATEFLKNLFGLN